MVETLNTKDLTARNLRMVLSHDCSSGITIILEIRNFSLRKDRTNSYRVFGLALTPDGSNFVLMFKQEVAFPVHDFYE
jgi:hypothetical protein